MHLHRFARPFLFSVSPERNCCRIQKCVCLYLWPPLNHRPLPRSPRLLLRDMCMPRRLCSHDPDTEIEHWLVRGALAGILHAVKLAGRFPPVQDEVGFDPFELPWHSQ